MNKMVKQLPTLSSLESGSDRTVMERFDLTELIQGVINSARIMVQQAEAEVKFECSGPVWVWADEFKIEEVVTNYLSNAIHHVGGEKKIVIRITRDGDKVRVSVFNTERRSQRRRFPTCGRSSIRWIRQGPENTAGPASVFPL